MASTQEVWDHHVEGFVARDLPMVLEDYDFATDTFTIEDGKFALQTIGFVKHEKT